MKIKNKTKGCLVFVFGAVVLVTGIGIGGWYNTAKTEIVKAYEIDDSDELVGAGNFSGAEVDDWGDDAYSDISNEEVRTDLAGFYDARDHYVGIRTKNQKTEGICGIYSSVTTLEYAIAKKHGDDNVEISPKHLDYQLVKAENAYKQSGVVNAYFDRYATAHPESGNRKLGKGSSQYLMLFGYANPLSIMSESDFANVVKENDIRLNGISRYEDLWSLDGHDDWLEGGRYTTLQDFDKINDSEKVEYEVTGAKSIEYPYYGEREDRAEIVGKIKSIVDKYGAVDVSVHANIDANAKCSYDYAYDYYNEKKGVHETRHNYTLLDHGSQCNAATLHGMAIVGWDDEWEYYDDGVKKTGAFILQNSWGEDAADKMKWHLSYDSRFYGMYFDSIEKYNEYSYHYGAFDYKTDEVEPDADEYVFSIAAGEGNKILKEITFNEYDNPYDYDVYLGTDDSDDTFEKIGSFKTEKGINKYVIENDALVNGDFVVKMKRSGESGISDVDRKRSVLNVMANNVWTLSFDMNGVDNVPGQSCEASGATCYANIPTEIPERDGYVFLGYAGVADSGMALYQPGDVVTLSGDKIIYAVWEDGEDDELPVPNTAAATPDTGENTGTFKNNVSVLTYVLPLVGMALVGVIYFARRNRGHRKFDY